MTDVPVSLLSKQAPVTHDRCSSVMHGKVAGRAEVGAVVQPLSQVQRLTSLPKHCLIHI